MCWTWLLRPLSVKYQMRGMQLCFYTTRCPPFLPPENNLRHTCCWKHKRRHARVQAYKLAPVTLLQSETPRDLARSGRLL